MSVFKDNWNGYQGKWRVQVRYVDWQGNKKVFDKRGFNSKREAKEFEIEFIAKKSKDINMSFGSFIDIYLDDIKPHIKPTTLETKETIIETHIRPYFQNLSLSEITNREILCWQNELLLKRDKNDRGYSSTYLRTIQNQLNAIFNHACNYYELPKNPCRKIKKMGRAKAGEMMFWTLDEYRQFSNVIKDKPESFYAFEVLYWTGIRCGELLALTRGDFDLEDRKLYINKNLQYVKSKEIIQTPKTMKSNRVIELPDFLCREMEDYFSMLYKVKPENRIFNFTKSYLHHEMERGTNNSGVKKIRIHDLRHSSVALMVEMNYTPAQIAERLGHESIAVTETYSYLYPSVQRRIADGMDRILEERIATEKGAKRKENE